MNIRCSLLGGMVGIGALIAGVMTTPAYAGSDCYLGEISAFAGSYAPRGYAFARGQLMSISGNEALYSILGTTYGGDGRTSFALPDLTGRVIVGAGKMLAGRLYPLGERGGMETVTLTTSQMPAHTHDATLQAVSADGDKSDPNGNMLAIGVIPSGRGSTTKVKNYSSSVSSPVAMNGQAVKVSSTGGGTPVPVMQPYTVINYIICTEGLFPPRN